jgi:hypothetical protein
VTKATAAAVADRPDQIVASLMPNCNPRAMPPAIGMLRCLVRHLREDRGQAETLGAYRQELADLLLDAVMDSTTVSLSKDGNMYCALLGENLAEGDSGFAPTPADALRSLAAALDRAAPPPGGVAYTRPSASRGRESLVGNDAPTAPAVSRSEALEAVFEAVRSSFSPHGTWMGDFDNAAGASPYPRLWRLVCAVSGATERDGGA